MTQIEQDLWKKWGELGALAHRKQASGKKTLLVDYKRPKAEKIPVTVENALTVNSEFETALADLNRATEAVLENSIKFCKKVSADGLDVIGKMTIVLENELAQTTGWSKRYKLKRQIKNLEATEKELKEIVNAK